VAWTIHSLRALLVAAILAVVAALPAAASDEVTIIVFWGDGCPHCATEHAFLEELTAEFPAVAVEDYEVWYHPENMRRFEDTAREYGVEPMGVPTTFFGAHVWIGFDDRVAAEIRTAVEAAVGGAEADDADTDDAAVADESASVLNLPILGSVDVANVPLVAATVAIGLVDGFNPCSLWALSVLLALVVRGGSRARIAAVGGTFLMVTATIYGAFILGAYGALSLVSHLDWVRVAVASVALVFGLVNVKDYVWFQSGPSLSIPERSKPALFERMRGVALGEKSLLLAVVGTAGLAAGVAVLELPCTAGFPVLWANLVSEAGLGQQATMGLLGVYLGFYLLDELIVVVVVVAAMRATKLQERHGRVLKLVSGALMIALATVLVVAPQAMQSLSAMLLVPLVTGVVVVVVMMLRRITTSSREGTRV
jgi:cytochrome c biogenesis protein CcdA/glutaredoxin